MAGQDDAKKSKTFNGTVGLWRDLAWVVLHLKVRPGEPSTQDKFVIEAVTEKIDRTRAKYKIPPPPE